MRRAVPRALVTGLLIALASCGSSKPAAGPSHPRISITVGSRPTGRPLAPGFVGISMEYSALPAYASPPVVRLIHDLSPGQRPELRIGGNSADEAWWPRPGQAPRGAQLALSGSWLRAAETLSRSLDARMVMGLNLAAGQPAVAHAEASAFDRGIGPQYIEAFEIGNEPDLYGLFPWSHERSLRRPPGYDLSDFIGQFSRWRAAIGDQLPVTGPAYATFDWSLGRFIDAEPGLKLVTFHHYPLDACLTKPSANGYPTIASLLSDQSSAGFANRLAPVVAIAHAHGLPFRLDELNSASCGGKPGVSNSSTSAVWMLDTLFNLVRVGVDGVNVHTFPGAAYAPFSPTGIAYPEYYGMLMFTRAFPPEARLLPVAVLPSGPLKAWATVGPGRAIRVVLINKSPQRTYQVQLHAPGLSGTVRLKRLRGGRSTGSAGSITVPAASAVLVTR